MKIRIGEPSNLVIDTPREATTRKADVSGHEVVRKGQDISFRERLEASLINGESNLNKNMFFMMVPEPRPENESLVENNGEQFHIDNDPQVEALVSSAEEIYCSETALFEKAFGVCDEIIEKSKYTKRTGSPGNYEYTYPGDEAKQKKAKEALGTRSAGFVRDNSYKTTFVMDDETWDEERAIFAKQKKAAEKYHAEKKQKALLKELRAKHGAKKKKETVEMDKVGGAESFKPLGGEDEEMTKELQAKHEAKKKKEQENEDMKPKSRRAGGTLDKLIEKSALDEICEEIISKGKQKRRTIKDQIELDKKKENVLLPLKKANGFVKAEGPGGVIFDFGSRTGNPLADQANALLSRNSDIVQVQTANYQQQAYRKSLTEFVLNGDQEQAAPFSPINKSWDKQLYTSVDEQVNAEESAKALRQDAIDKSETFAMVNGEKVVPTSDTDAAVLEMFKAGTLGN